MLFNSLTFWVFFPLFCILYFFSKRNVRLWIILLGSYLFYGWFDFRFLSLIIALTFINFYLGVIIGDFEIPPKKRKRWLAISVTCSLSILGIFKYFNFFTEGILSAIRAAGIGDHAGFNLPNIVLPVGISFYVFSAMTYTLDLYWGKIETERSLLRFATYVAFFPKLVAGPIVRAYDFLPQLYDDHKISWDRLVAGICLILWGLVLKVVLADSLSAIVDNRFASPENHSSISLLIGVVFYAFQIYGDFAGYSLIAIGLAKILGFDFLQNFDRPYFSKNFSEFWQRWHISLSSWLRDYLYIPLGGSRKGALRTVCNLMTTMLLCGLWHGASWTFVAWGGIHGVYLTLQRIPAHLKKRLTLKCHIPKVVTDTIMVLFCFSLTCIAWVFFRASSLSDALLILAKIFSLQGLNFSTVIGKFLVIKGGVIIFVITLIEGLSFKFNLHTLADKHHFFVGCYIVLCITIISLFGTFDTGTFIYFQF